METETRGKSKFAAPDRDEIYHVRMPTGKTTKTRGILEKQSVLRDKGVIKRGVTGVRVSGVEVSRFPSSLSKVSAASKMIQRQKPAKAVMIQDISSSSLIPNAGSMRSDAISTRTTIVASTPTVSRSRLVAASGSLRKIAVMPTIQRNVISSSNPDFRVRLNLNPTAEYKSSAALSQPSSMVMANRVTIPRKNMLAQRVQVSGVSALGRPMVSRMARETVVAFPSNSMARRPMLQYRQEVPVIKKRGSILNRISINR